MLIWMLMCHYEQTDVGSGNTIHQIKYVNRDLRQKTQSILSFNLNSQCQHRDLRTTAEKID